MKRGIIVLVALWLTFGLAWPQNNKDIVGTWNGKLEVRGITMRVTFNITDTTGALTATMDSPDQGAYGIPMDSCLYRNDTVRITSAALYGEYKGVLSDNLNALEGTWTQGGMSLPLNLERGDKIVLLRPQEPKPPYPYREEEISYPNEKGKTVLAGTFTRPKEGGPFTATLLITGSGAQDRDESIFGHKPFAVLADYLTRQGIAVLRIDDRGVGGSTGDLISATTEDFAGDAAAGIDYLKSREDVDKGKIGLIGHSEGGIIAPMLAAQREDVAFIVLLAGTGVPGDEILAQQAADVMAADNNTEEELKAFLQLQKNLMNIAKKDIDTDSAMAEIKRMFIEWKAALPEEVLAKVDSTDQSQWEQSFNKALIPWTRYFMRYDPRPALQKVKCPVLALNGEKDIQVRADINLPAIETALKTGGHTQYRVGKLPNLNHLFQTCQTGTVSEYGNIEETFSPEALKIIADWILTTTR